jgi:hypothetical protein
MVQFMFPGIPGFNAPFADQMPFVFPAIWNGFDACIVSNAMRMDAFCNPSGFIQVL